MKDNPHKGHRDRLREEFLSHSGSAKMPNHKLLEMLLFYGIPQRDTNELAHNLINTFGSLHAVFEADVIDLAKIKGMTKNAACLIKLILPIAKSYILDKYNDESYLRTTEEIGNFILARFFAAHKEQCAILCLNHMGRVLAYDILSEGDIDSVGISVRSIIEKTLQTGATSIVIAHNHPGGIALPSQSDVRMTEAIADALRTVSVKFIDHLIIAGDDYVSMASTTEYKEIFD